MPNRKKISKDLIKSICALIEEGGHTIAEICSLSNISERSFYKWQAENADYAVEISRARENANQIIIKEAKKSLMKLIKGYEIVETETKSKKRRNGQQYQIITITTKHIPGDLSSIIMVLNNKAPAEFKNRHKMKITGKNGKNLIPARVLSKKEAKDISSP